MANYTATVAWRLKPGEDFLKGQYSRGHDLSFDGGIEVAGSASPHIVGKWADPSAIDPEEMLVAAISSCHMLTFLHKARLAGLVALAYRDDAAGVLAEVAPGRWAVTHVTLKPAIEWAGQAPDAETLAALHHAAHDECYIANSVTTKVTVAEG